MHLLPIIINTWKEATNPSIKKDNVGTLGINTFAIEAMILSNKMITPNLTASDIPKLSVIERYPSKKVNIIRCNTATQKAKINDCISSVLYWAK